MSKIKKYICPKCKSIHWWQAERCWNPKCKYNKTLDEIKKPQKKVN